MRVHVELWVWLGEKLGGDFESPSEMRHAAALEAEEGMTVAGLFRGLSARNPLLVRKVFNRESGKFSPALNVLVTRQGRLVSPFNLEEDPLQEGDKVTVTPLYAGG